MLLPERHFRASFCSLTLVLLRSNPDEHLIAWWLAANDFVCPAEKTIGLHGQREPICREKIGFEFRKNHHSVCRRQRGCQRKICADFQSNDLNDRRRRRRVNYRDARAEAVEYAMIDTIRGIYRHTEIKDAVSYAITVIA